MFTWDTVHQLREGPCVNFVNGSRYVAGIFGTNWHVYHDGGEILIRVTLCTVTTGGFFIGAIWRES